MTIPDGGPAFPQHIETRDSVTLASYDVPDGSGMSLRDYFAAQCARQSAEVVCDMLQSDGHGDPVAEAERHARAAYIVADAMLKARDQ